MEYCKANRSKADNYKLTADEPVAMEKVQKVWRNIFVSQALQYNVGQFVNFLGMVRTINLTLSDSKKFRVIAGGVPFNCSKQKVYCTR